MEDFGNGKTTLEELRDSFKKAYLHWREVAERFGVRFDEVELAWLKYCKARDTFMKYRDNDLYC